jgi:hypothetical protein
MRRALVSMTILECFILETIRKCSRLMEAQSIIRDGVLQPNALRIVLEAFEAACLTLAPHNHDLEVVAVARLKLAEAMAEIAKFTPLDVSALMKAVLKAHAE